MAKNMNNVDMKKWLTNFSKSIAYASKDVIGDFMPNTKTTIDTIRDSATEFRDYVSSYKSQANVDLAQMDRTGIEKKVKKSLSDILADVKSGDFYHTNSDAYSDFGDDAGVDMDFDFGNGEDFDEDGNPIGDQSISNDAKLSAKASIAAGNMTVAAIGEMSERIQRTHVKTTQAALKSVMNTQLLTMNRLTDEVRGTNARLDLLNKQVSSIVKFNQESQMAANEAALKHYGRMEEAMTMMMKMYGGDNRLRSKGSKSDLLQYGFDANTYKDMVKSNFKNSELVTGIQMASEFIGMMRDVKGFSGGGPGILGNAIKGLMKASVRKHTKKSLMGIDALLPTVLNIGLGRLGEHSEEANIKGILADIFGLRTIATGKASLSAYKKGAVAWDGKSKKALEEVIPHYLMNIENILQKSLMHQKDAQRNIFDYETGIFVRESDVNSIQKERMADKRRGYYSEYDSVVQKKLRPKLTEAEYSKIYSEVNELTIKAVYSFEEKRTTMPLKTIIQEVTRIWKKNTKVPISGSELRQLSFLVASGVQKERQGNSDFGFSSYMSNSTETSAYRQMMMSAGKTAGGKINFKDQLGSINEFTKSLAAQRQQEVYDKKRHDEFKSEGEKFVSGARKVAEKIHGGIPKPIADMLDNIERQLDRGDIAVASSINMVANNIISAMEGTTPNGEDYDVGKLSHDALDSLKDYTKYVADNKIRKKAVSKPNSKFSLPAGMDYASAKAETNAQEFEHRDMMDAIMDVALGAFGMGTGPVGYGSKDIKRKNGFVAKVSKSGETQNQNSSTFESVMSKMVESIGVSSKGSEESTKSTILSQLKSAGDALYTEFGGKKGLKRGIKGAGIGLVASMFLPGGPIGGAFLGAAAGILSSSVTFKKFMYGDKEVDKNGNVLSIKKTGFVDQWKNTLEAHLVDNVKERSNEFLVDTKAYWHKQMDGPIAELRGQLTSTEKDVGGAITRISKSLVNLVLHPIKNLNTALNRMASGLLDATTALGYTAARFGAHLGINLLKAPIKFGSFMRSMIKTPGATLKETAMITGKNAVRRIGYAGTAVKKFFKGGERESYADYRERAGAFGPGVDLAQSIKYALEEIDAKQRYLLTLDPNSAEAALVKTEIDKKRRDINVLQQKQIVENKYAAGTVQARANINWKEALKNNRNSRKFQNLRNKYSKEDANQFRDLSNEEFEKRKVSLSKRISGASPEIQAAFKRVKDKEDLENFILNPRTFVQMKDAQENQENLIKSEKDYRKYIATLLTKLSNAVSGDDDKAPDEFRYTPVNTNPEKNEAVSENSEWNADQNISKIRATLTGMNNIYQSKGVFGLATSGLAKAGGIAGKLIEKTTGIPAEMIVNDAKAGIGQAKQTGKSIWDTTKSVIGAVKNITSGTNTSGSSTGMGPGPSDNSSMNKLAAYAASILSWVSKGRAKIDVNKPNASIVNSNQYDKASADSESSVTKMTSDVMEEVEEWKKARSGATSTDNSKDSIVSKIPSDSQKGTLASGDEKSKTGNGIIDSIINFFGGNGKNGFFGKLSAFFGGAGGSLLGGATAAALGITGGITIFDGIKNALGLNNGTKTLTSEAYGTTDTDGNRTIYTDAQGNATTASDPNAQKKIINNSDLTEDTIHRGGKALVGAASVTATGISKMGSGISKAAAKISTTAGGKMLEKAGKAGATGAGKIWTGMIDLAKKAVDKVSSSKTVQKLVGDDTILGKVLGKLDDMLGKLAGASDDILNSFKAKLSSFWAKITGDTAKNILSKVVFVVGLAQVGWDVITGALDAANLFQVREDDVDWAMRAISMILKTGIDQLPAAGTFIELFAEIGCAILGFDIKTWVASKLYEFMWSLDKNNKGPTLQEKQDTFKQDVADYNTKNGTSLSVDAYNDMTNKTTGQKVVDTAKSAWSGVKNAAATVWNVATWYPGKTSNNSSNTDTTSSFNTTTPSYAAQSGGTGYGAPMKSSFAKKIKFGNGSLATNGCGAFVAGDLNGKNSPMLNIHTTNGGTSTSDIASATGAMPIKVGYGIGPKTSRILSRPGIKAGVLGKGGKNFTNAGHWISTQGIGNGLVKVNDPLRGTSIQDVKSLGNVESALVKPGYGASVGTSGTETAGSSNIQSSHLKALADMGYSIKNNSVFYSQGANPWKSTPFAGSTISKYGCTATSASMGISDMTGKNVTPDVVAKYGGSNGISAAQIAKAASNYGLDATDVIYGENATYGTPSDFNTYSSKIMGWLKNKYPVYLFGNKDGKNIYSFNGKSGGQHAVLASYLKNGNILVANPARGKPSDAEMEKQYDASALKGLRYAIAFKNKDGSGMDGTYGDVGNGATVTLDGDTSVTSNDTTSSSSTTTTVFDKFTNALSTVGSALSSVGTKLIGALLGGGTAAAATLASNASSLLEDAADINDTTSDTAAGVNAQDTSNGASVSLNAASGSNPTSTVTASDAYKAAAAAAKKSAHGDTGDTTRGAFFNQILKPVISGASTSQVLPSVTLAQAAVESGWGKSKHAVTLNNLFGVRSGTGWKSYDSWQSSINGYDNLMGSSNNYAKIRQAKDYASATNALGQTNYCTSPSAPEYAKSIRAAIEANGLSAYDTQSGQSAALAGQPFGTFNSEAMGNGIGYGLQAAAKNVNFVKLASEKNTSSNSTSSTKGIEDRLDTIISIMQDSSGTITSMNGSYKSKLKTGNGIGYGDGDMIGFGNGSVETRKTTTQKVKDAGSTLRKIQGSTPSTTNSQTSSRLRSIHNSIATGYRKSLR